MKATWLLGMAMMSTGAHAATREETIDAWMRDYTGQVPGASVLVLEGGKAVFQRSYGLADLEPFAKSTHKYELRYTDMLVGPWPEARETWRERSPIHSFDRISCPVIVLQGLEDEVVPPEQAELMVEALRANGLPHAYLAFEGEQHGFRKAESIRRALEAELSFYAQVLGFELGDPIAPVEVHGLR